MSSTSRARIAPIFQPGTLISGVLIGECLNPTAMVRWRRYAVFYDCCDTPAELSHYRIIRRQEQGISRCPACQRRDNAAHRRAKPSSDPAAEHQHPQPSATLQNPKPQATSAPPPRRWPLSPTILVDRFGHHWPPLGPLGPRWATGATKFSQIGTGKEKR
jgi:hypothetical protein